MRRSDFLVPSTQVPRLQIIEPGNASNSYLMFKLEGRMGELPECAEASRCGSRMPMVGGAPLDAAALDTIRSWINAGAPL